MPNTSLLLVEMDVQVAGALELFLSGRGYAVRAAATPAEAMRAAATEPIDVVVIGYLPDSTDTSTVVQRLREILGSRPVRIVVMAGSMDDLPGADLIIPRDAHPRAIIDALRTAARKRTPTAPLPTIDVP